MPPLTIFVIIIETVADLFTLTATDFALTDPLLHRDKLGLCLSPLQIHSVRVKSVEDAVQVLCRVVIRKFELIIAWVLQLTVLEVIKVDNLGLLPQYLLISLIVCFLALNSAFVQVQLELTINLLVLH